MPYLPVDDTRLYYDERGEGPPLLLVHGLGSSSRDWFEQVSHFADRYRVLRIDLRGHGRSERPPGPYHIAQFARDVAVGLRRLNAAPAHVVGLSMGGMVALELAASAPALVRSLVITNSVADTRLQTWADLWFYVSRRVTVQVLGVRPPRGASPCRTSVSEAQPGDPPARICEALVAERQAGLPLVG